MPDSSIGKLRFPLFHRKEKDRRSFDMSSRAKERRASRASEASRRRREPLTSEHRRPAPSFVRTLSVPTPFPVGPVNVHLIKREPITLIDSGPLTEEAWDALVAGLRVEGLTVRDIQRVLLTHGHHDHFGLAARIADV